MMSLSKFFARECKLVRIFFLAATIVSIILLLARKAGMVFPYPVLWMSWLVIDIKIALKLAELASFLHAKKAKNWSARKGVSIRLNPFLSLILAEVTIARGFIDSWKRRDIPVEGFAFRDAPEYQSMKYALGISVLVELPFLSFLFYILPILASYRVLIEGVILAISAYVLIAFRADRYAVKHSAHRLTDNELIVHMGLRVKGMVPLDCVTTVAHLKMGEWRSFVRKCKLDGKSVAKVSPLDKPNVVLSLVSHSVELEWMHGNTTWPDYIGLYVDNPHRLLTDLRANCSYISEDHPNENIAV